MTTPRGGAGQVPSRVTGPQPAQQTAPRTEQMSVAPEWGALISVNRDGTDGTRYPLTGEWVDIGRSEADISFEDDHFLAERHARFEVKQGHVFVIPLDSMNGVFHKISQRTELAHGSHVLLGRELLRLELLVEGEREAHPLIRHGVSMFGSPVRRAWGRLMQLIPNGGVRDVRHLAGELMTVGREEGDILFRDDEFLSRRHAAFRWHDGKCILEDLNSSNGTFVRIVKPLRLSRGDKLRFGDQMFRFEPVDG